MPVDFRGLQITCDWDCDKCKGPVVARKNPKLRYHSEFSYNFHYFWFSVFWMLHNRQWHNTRQKFKAMERDWEKKVWVK